MRKRITDGLLKSDGNRTAGDFPFDPEMRRAIEGQPLRAAAVLVPIVERPGGYTVLLTRRAGHLTSHAGQISFPGGRIEQADQNPVVAALRETEEEVGVAPASVDVVGQLDEYHTGTGFSITPVVGFVRPDIRLRPDPAEVAEAFEVPFDFLMDPANHMRHRMKWQGLDREYHAIPYQQYYIWGATAGMLLNLYGKIRE
ncbi:MAG: CoA pyrophosphatase [Sphingomonadales bacterium]